MYFLFDSVFAIGVVLVVVALRGGEARLSQKPVVDDNAVSNANEMSVRPELAFPQTEEHRELQSNNDCSSFLLCKSQFLGLDGRKVYNNDPILGGDCVDRCIPSPFLFFWKGFLNYKCGICILGSD
jgi:hypothetical protein